MFCHKSSQNKLLEFFAQGSECKEICTCFWISSLNNQVVSFQIGGAFLKLVNDHFVPFGSVKSGGIVRSWCSLALKEYQNK